MAFSALPMKALDEAELVNSHVFGPKTGRGAIDFTSLAQKDKFA
jgi:hypothetical protein